MRHCTYKSKTKYKGVYIYTNNKTGSECIEAHIPTKSGKNTKLFNDVRSAAIAVDKGLLNIGKEPVNVLKRL